MTLKHLVAGGILCAATMTALPAAAMPIANLPQPRPATSRRCMGLRTVSLLVAAQLLRLWPAFLCGTTRVLGTALPLPLLAPLVIGHRRIKSFVPRRPHLLPASSGRRLFLPNRSSDWF